MTCHHAPIDHHQPIPEDSAHCPCGIETMDMNGQQVAGGQCLCPCHGPSWLTDGDSEVPDFSPAELQRHDD